MIGWNRLYREAGISLGGLKKGLLEIAITMSENTRIAKLLYRTFELEKKMDKLYIRTGQTVHELHHLPFNEIAGNDSVMENLVRIKSIKSDIHRIEQEIALLREEHVKSKLDELTRYMRRGGYTVEEFIVEQHSAVIDKSPEQIILPDGGSIVAVIHNETLVMPQNVTKITGGDRVFVLSPVTAVREAAILFSSSVQLT